MMNMRSCAQIVYINLNNNNLGFILSKNGHDEIIITLDAKKTIILCTAIIVGAVTIFTYLQALFAFVTPSPSLPLDITSVLTLDTSNASKMVFSAGETVRINSVVEHATGYYFWPDNYYWDFGSPLTYNVIVAVSDGSKTPVYFAQSVKTISPGSLQETVFNYNLASGASSGIYTIKVMTWDSAGLPYAPTAEEVTFTVS